MKIIIQSSKEDLDDKLVNFELQAETEGYKGTTSFYGYSDEFKELAEKILRFPFESSEPIRFAREIESIDDPGSGVIIKIKLHDSVGHIDLNIVTTDEQSNFANFSETIIETEALHRFARMLQHANFAKPTMVDWDSYHA